MRMHRKGNTIVEILTVIAIITLIAGIYVSVTSSSKQKAFETSCMSTLRQNYIALNLYTEDNSGGEYLHSNVPISNSALRDPILLMPYLKSEDMLFCPETPECARQKLVSSYIRTALPLKGHPLRKMAEGQIEERFSTDTGYPLMHCLVHDELHYYQKEKHLNSLVNPPYVIRLLPNGSTKSGRYQIPRGHDIEQSCR